MSPGGRGLGRQGGLLRGGRPARANSFLLPVVIRRADGAAAGSPRRVASAAHPAADHRWGLELLTSAARFLTPWRLRSALCSQLRAGMPSERISFLVERPCESAPGTPPSWVKFIVNSMAQIFSIASCPALQARWAPASSGAASRASRCIPRRLLWSRCRAWRSAATGPPL